MALELVEVLRVTNALQLQIAKLQTENTELKTQVAELTKPTAKPAKEK